MVAAVGRNGLTAKQEAFALAYTETGNAAEAYRRAYDVSPNAKDSWIYVEATQLLDNPKIADRIEQIQAEAARLSLYTIKRAFDEYEEARALALQSGNPSAAVSAVAGKVKLFGLDAPTKSSQEVTHRIVTEMADEELAAAIREKAERLSQPPVQ